MHFKNVPLGEVKAGPEDGLEEGQFLVYPSTFTREPDSYGEVIAPGAFIEDLAAWKSQGITIPGLYGHRMDDPDFFVAYALETGEDQHGWWVKGQFDLESPKGRTVYKLVKGRRLNQLSFAFDVLDSADVQLEDGRKARELRKLKVYEFSFVPIGANQDTGVVAIKAAAEQLEIGLKEGRVLAAKHINSLRSAQDAIGVVIAAAIGEDQEKASGQQESKDEEPPAAKSEDQPVESSAKTLAEKALIFDIELSV